MNVQEYRETLESLSDKERKDFIDKFGGKERTSEELVRDYADNPEHERRICYLLNLKTENEKISDSVIHSARSAQTASKTAFWSCIATFLIAIATIIALIIQ